MGLIGSQAVPIGTSVRRERKRALSDTRTEAAEIRTTFTTELRDAVEGARAKIAAVLEPATPSEEFLFALAEEVRRAETAPDSVPYPELAEPDRYWDASVIPQIRTLGERLAVIVEWLESQVIAAMAVAERGLRLMVEDAADSRDPSARSALEAALTERCEELHAQMGDVATVLPDAGPLSRARQALVDAVQSQAAADVDTLRSHYLAEAGGDEAHQRFAEQQWAETYGDRVTHRAAMLAAVTPWRHQEMALVGYERSVSACAENLEATVARLRMPLRDIPTLLLDEFDAAVTP